MPLFQVCDLFLDQTRRDGAGQMALDEALLDYADRPLLRIYTWSEPTATFGYSQSLAAVRSRFRSMPCARRWTGGGVVEHGCDWTFSLVVPFGEPLAKERPSDSYRLIHSCVATTLRQMGCSAHLADRGDGDLGMACFSSPVIHDVIDLNRRKLCGGAQRRTRNGLLHQGSIQNVCLPENFALHLLSSMAARTFRVLPGKSLFARAQELLARKYGTDAWLAKVS